MERTYLHKYFKDKLLVQAGFLKRELCLYLLQQEKGCSKGPASHKKEGLEHMLLTRKKVTKKRDIWCDRSSKDGIGEGS